jgi:hypothetical protein
MMSSYEEIANFIIRKYNLPPQITKMEELKGKTIQKAFNFGECFCIIFTDKSILSLKSVMQYEDLEEPEIDTELNHYILITAYCQLELYKQKLTYALSDYLTKNPMYEEYKKLYAELFNRKKEEEERRTLIVLQAKYGKQFREAEK